MKNWSVEDLEHFEDSYSGEYDSFRDYAVELFDELYLHDVPEHIQSYIDYDKFFYPLDSLLNWNLLYGNWSGRSKIIYKNNNRIEILKIDCS